jgi:hypothetical protein
MNTMAKLLSLAGASCALAIAVPAPATAAPKPCCYNNGQYFESSPSTCRRYGGYVVEYQYCGYGGYYGPGYRDDGYYGSYNRRPGVSVTFDLGDVFIGYSDGYYDRHRRWHRWHNHHHRDYFRKHRSHSYHHMRRDDDRRRRWRD